LQKVGNPIHKVMMMKRLLTVLVFFAMAITIVLGSSLRVREIPKEEANEKKAIGNKEREEEFHRLLRRRRRWQVTGPYSVAVQPPPRRRRWQVTGPYSVVVQPPPRRHKWLVTGPHYVVPQAPPRRFFYAARPRPDIVDTAISSGLTTLVQLVQAAELEDTLRGPGPFTVFAPTNRAFAALPADTLAALEADTAALADVLLYHVLPDTELRTFGRAFRSGGPFETAAEGSPTVETQRFRSPGSGRGQLIKQVNNVTVTLSDVSTSNGVVHVIDAVLLPSDTELPVMLPTAEEEDAETAADVPDTVVDAVP
jgi:uncharacterized surface protein with fasciclin (FAS1) repeats